MKKSDIEKLSKFCNAATSILSINYSIDRNNFCKITTNIENADLIVINKNTVSDITQVLSKVTSDCTILIMNALPLEAQLEAFFERNARFQFSKLMMIDGARETMMTVVHTKPKDIQYSRNDQITIFLVLKTGGDTYTSRYVNATANNIRANLTYNAEIVCLTDDSTGIDSVDRIIKMEHNWPKWWGKLEMFKPGVTGNKHCLYIDLDTVCFKNIDFLCNLPPAFYGIRDFYHLSVLQTGILKWEVNSETQDIYLKNLHHIDKYFNKGDHELIGESVTEPKYLQDIFPGEICSYKKHMGRLYKQYITPSVVCFHGTPRPHTVKHDLIVRHWKY